MMAMVIASRALLGHDGPDGHDGHDGHVGHGGHDGHEKSAAGLISSIV